MKLAVASHFSEIQSVFVENSSDVFKTRMITRSLMTKSDGSRRKLIHLTEQNYTDSEGRTVEVKEVSDV